VFKFGYFNWGKLHLKYAFLLISFSKQCCSKNKNKVWKLLGFLKLVHYDKERRFSWSHSTTYDFK